LRRDSLDICADILYAAQFGAKKSHIVYKANLNFSIFRKYLLRLLDKGLIEKSDERHFITTQKGVQFLNKYRDFVLSMKKNMMVEE
jgi:predicted transcriptional regulator